MYCQKTAAQDTNHPDETRLSPQVKEAVNAEANYRLAHNLPPLTNSERQAQEAQAEELLAVFRTTLHNPKTVAVSLWDFTDRNSWMGNSGGVLDESLAPKVSYFALQNLIESEKKHFEAR